MATTTTTNIIINPTIARQLRRRGLIEDLELSFLVITHTGVYEPIAYVYDKIDKNYH